MFQRDQNSHLSEYMASRFWMRSKTGRKNETKNLARFPLGLDLVHDARISSRVAASQLREWFVAQRFQHKGR